MCAVVHSFWRPFALDRVVGPEVGQEGMFHEVEHIAASVVDGFRACIFAYGITGGGKTYTMEGVAGGTQHCRSVCCRGRCCETLARCCTRADPGVNIRTMDKIFELCAARGATHTFTVTLSMLEIYNDEVCCAAPCRADCRVSLGLSVRWHLGRATDS